MKARYWRATAVNAPHQLPSEADDEPDFSIGSTILTLGLGRDSAADRISTPRVANPKLVAFFRRSPENIDLGRPNSAGLL